MAKLNLHVLDPKADQLLMTVLLQGPVPKAVYINDKQAQEDLKARQAKGEKSLWLDRNYVYGIQNHFDQLWQTPFLLPEQLAVVTDHLEDSPNNVNAEIYIDERAAFNGIFGDSVNGSANHVTYVDQTPISNPLIKGKTITVQSDPIKGMERVGYHNVTARRLFMVPVADPKSNFTTENYYFDSLDKTEDLFCLPKNFFRYLSANT